MSTFLNFSICRRGDVSSFVTDTLTNNPIAGAVTVSDVAVDIDLSLPANDALRLLLEAHMASGSTAKWIRFADFGDPDYFVVAIELESSADPAISVVTTADSAYGGGALLEAVREVNAAAFSPVISAVLGFALGRTTRDVAAPTP